MNNSIPSHKKYGLFKVSLIVLTLCLFIGGVAYSAAYRCVPCKENYYCLKGNPVMCPAETPVTQGTGAKKASDCMTCVQRNGNETNPVFDDTVNDCVSCYEYSNGATPYWNGSACVACASGTAYNIETGLCESSCPGNINDAGVCILTAQLNECESGYIGIMTAEQLAKIGVDSNYPLSGNYCLLNDISLSAYGSNYNNGEGWTPIGFDLEVLDDFGGIFDGNGHVISDLYINRPNTDQQGLFGFVHGTIRNLGVDNCSVTGKNYVGCIGAYTGTYTNCYATNIKVTGENGVGGLVGTGTMYGVYIEKSYTSGSVTGTSCAGGLVCDNIGVRVPIINSYSTANVKGGTVVGGLIGIAYCPSWLAVSNSYFAGTITITDENGIGSPILASMGGCGDTPPEAGFVYDSHTTCFSDKQVAEKYVTYTLKTTAEMQTPQTFIDAGWDTTIWELIQGQYPKLKNVGGQ